MLTGNSIKKSLSRKTRASTLVEVVVAMTMMLVFMFLAMIIMSNINKNSNSKMLARAHVVTSYYMKYTLNEKRFFNESFHDAGMMVEKTIEELNSNAIIITIQALKNDTLLITEKKQILRIYEEDLADIPLQ